MSKVWGSLVVLVVVLVAFVFDETWEAILIGSIFVAVFSALAQSARKSERKEEQIKKDQLARTILEQLEVSKNEESDKPS